MIQQMIKAEQNEVNNDINNSLHIDFYIGEIGYIYFNADVSIPVKNEVSYLTFHTTSTPLEYAQSKAPALSTAEFID